RDLTLVAQRLQVPVGRAEALADPPEAEQSGVRVGRVREPLEHRREQRALDGRGPGETAGQRLEVTQGAAGIGVPEGGEALSGRLGGESRAGRGHPGHGLEQWPVEELLVESAYLAAMVRPRLLERAGGTLREAHAPSEPPQRLVVAGYDVRAAQVLQLDAVLQGA